MSVRSLLRRLPLYSLARGAYSSVRRKRMSVWQLSEQYDLDFAAILKQVLTAPDATAVDVGANAGTILREMFATSPRGRHFAFEPIPSLAEALTRTFPTARVHAVALSDEASMATFHHITNCPAESGLRMHRTHVKDPQVRQITVAVKRLDDVVQAEDQIAVIKIDAEGAELPIIRGSAETIRRCKPVIVFESGTNTTPYYGVGPDDIFDTISNFGMRLSTMRRWLDGGKPYLKHKFRQAYERTEEFYFIAY